MLKTYQPQSSRDRFVPMMEPFLKKAKESTNSIEMLHNLMLNNWKDLYEFFAFDAKKYKMEAFFADVNTFKEQYEVVLKCNIVW